MTTRGRIDLSMGGPSWAGWRFGSWGKAKEWRILAPDGSTFQASQLAALPGQVADLGYLQTLAREQAAKLAGSSLAFTRDESALVRVALQLLLRELPVQIGRRDPGAVPGRLLQAVK